MTYDRFNQLYSELVPSRGKAKTVAGEVLRVAKFIYTTLGKDFDKMSKSRLRGFIPYDFILAHLSDVASRSELIEKSVSFADNYTNQIKTNYEDVLLDPYGKDHPLVTFERYSPDCE